MRKKPCRILRLAVVLGLSVCLYSCGLEDVLYIDYIPEGSMTDNNTARIRLPSSSAEGYSSYFAYFRIFYRIYISGEPFSGLINTSTIRNQINSSLNSDFQGLVSLTDITSTTVNTSNLEYTFNSKKYFKLELEGADIDSILGTGSLGKNLEIFFSTINGERPVLILNGVPYTLQRAVSGPNILFRPEPDRYFLNHPDLYDTKKVTNEINADVATNTQSSTELKYTYVSMYIFAIGKDFITTIYSQPTHIGIFRLAEAY
jgi:hypothetical protein